MCPTMFYGRSDKIFCSAKCKTAYHEKLNKVTNEATAKIDKILHRNRSILLEILGKKGTYKKVHRRQLMPKIQLAPHHFLSHQHTKQGGSLRLRLLLGAFFRSGSFGDQKNHLNSSESLRKKTITSFPPIFKHLQTASPSLGRRPLAMDKNIVLKLLNPALNSDILKRIGRTGLCNILYKFKLFPT